VRSRQEKPLERGQPGWLEALAKDLENEKPKAGEFGWLVAMAKDMEEELRPSGDTTISNSSGELVSQRSSQGASSQGSRGNSDQIGGSSGEQSSTLRNVSDNNLSQSSRKLSQSRSQKSSQPSSQPSSIKVLATQAVSSRLFALAAADSQVDEFTTVSKKSEWVNSISIDDELESDVGDEGRSESSEEEVVESPDVPRLVVPGLLESVLEKFGQNKTFPQKSSESVVKKAASKSRNRKDMKKLKVAAETVTPKAFPTLARKTSAGAGKVAKNSKKRKLSQKAVVSMLKHMLIKKVEVRLSKNWQTQEPFAARVEEVICSLRGSSTGEKVVEKKLTRRLPAREKRPASQGRPKEGTRLKVMKGGKFYLSSVVMTRHSAAKVH